MRNILIVLFLLINNICHAQNNYKIIVLPINSKETYTNKYIEIVKILTKELYLLRGDETINFFDLKEKYKTNEQLSKIGCLQKYAVSVISKRQKILLDRIDKTYKNILCLANYLKIKQLVFEDIEFVENEIKFSLTLVDLNDFNVKNYSVEQGFNYKKIIRRTIIKLYKSEDFKKLNVSSSISFTSKMTEKLLKYCKKGEFKYIKQYGFDSFFINKTFSQFKKICKNNKKNWRLSYSEPKCNKKFNIDEGCSIYCHIYIEHYLNNPDFPDITTRFNIRYSLPYNNVKILDFYVVPEYN